MSSFQDAGRSAAVGPQPQLAGARARARPPACVHLVGVLLATGLMLTGCGAHAGKGAHAAPALDGPDELDPRGFAELARSFRKLDPDDPQRVPVRARLVRYLLKDAEH